MLIINNIFVQFNGFQALNGLTAQAFAGDFISIIGHNGAGKSTLIKVLAGRINPYSGSLILDNQDISQWSRIQRAQLISTLHQNITLGSIGTMTVEENLALALYKGRSVTLSRGLAILQQEPWLLDRWNTLFPHKNILHQQVRNLSGGQRQLLAFLIATARTPKLLLLDEPTAALDPSAADRMMSFINDFSSNTRAITIMVTHDLDAALTYGNKIWVIKNGIVAHEIDKQIRTMNGTELKTMLG
jgi:putative tryptophan/tyrosine transport system ATP-binding protein